MEQSNTFIITTEILSDLNKVTAKFFDKYDKELAEIEADQSNDTTWNFTYEMGKLSPPQSKLIIEYYLGTNPRPALVQGPFPITIHKTRPKWFDFLADTSFHDVQQSDSVVSFSIRTPLTTSGGIFHLNKTEQVILPANLQLFGDLINRLYPAITEAKLKWNIPSHKLELDQEAPMFYQKSTIFSGGSTSYIAGGFENKQDDSYFLDSKNDLIATQNFKKGGSISKAVPKIKKVVQKVELLTKVTNAIAPASIIIKPSFDIILSGSFDYTSRLHLITDTVSGKWGSYGNLNIDANPHHGDAYKNSASYNFYTTSFGIELQFGAKLVTGLVAGYFGLDGRIVFGWGHSYRTIPHYQTKALKSGAVQIYGRFVIAILWGFYSENIWGPKMFYSYNFWDDDMSYCFPSIGKSGLSPTAIPANSSWPELTNALKPVRKFSKMPMPVPEPNISTSQYNSLFTWLERGKTYGERKLETRYLDHHRRTFSDNRTIELNSNALNSHITDATKNKLSFFAWAQTRYDSKSILKVKPQDVVTEFVKAQDIWYAIYDQEKDTVILKALVEDDTKSITSGRAEANPVVTVISDSRAMITWQVADIENNDSEIWYVILEQSGDSWFAYSPKVLVKIDGVATSLELASTCEDEAVVTWLNTANSDAVHNKIMTALFDGTEWGSPKTLLDEKDNYYNYQVLKLNNSEGGLLIATFVEDSALNNFEKLLLIPWDAANNQWHSIKPFEIFVDSVNHLQLPRMVIMENGSATIAFKVEMMGTKDGNERISQIDLLVGDMNNLLVPWKHIEASEFVCDTTKQLDDLQITYVGDDTLMILSNEYPMLPTNTSFEPENGIIFGDPYMNLVLRCFAIDESGEVSDVDENNFFTDINEFQQKKANARLYQNYPNPCDDFTTITFDIPDNSKVKLELFDMKGNRVAILTERQFTAGRYEIELNTSLLHSGTYIYRITSGDYSTALRMIVRN